MRKMTDEQRDMQSALEGFSILGSKIIDGVPHGFRCTIEMNAMTTYITFDKPMLDFDLATGEMIGMCCAEINKVKETKDLVQYEIIVNAWERYLFTRFF